MNKFYLLETQLFAVTGALNGMQAESNVHRSFSDRQTQ